MKTIHFSRRFLALTVVSAAALLVACGGGETSLTPSESFVSRMATETPVPGSLPATAVIAKRASVATITNDQLFQWVQLQYPELFGSATPNVIANLSYNGQLFDVREFPGGTYLGISQGRVFGLGPFTNGQLVDFGVVQTYADQVCTRVNCGGAVNPGTGTGALNGCTLPASEVLRTGNRFVSVYKNDVFAPEASSGEYTTESVVDGPASFEGQSAIKVTSRLRGVLEGETIDLTTVEFAQLAENGLSRFLGFEVTASFLPGGLLTTVRYVNTPPLLNNEFTLQPGQSIEQTDTSTSTYINSPFPQPPTTDTSILRSTYEARETINVLGRSYNTCRYKSTGLPDGTTIFEWHIVGNGLTARIEYRNSAGAVFSREELKSATINGTAL
jgi:hypothetical protein